MIVKVKYYKGEINGYAGRDYTYRTSLPLQVGDHVIAPTAKEPNQRAIVTEINLPESVIDERWADRVRTIDRIDLEVLA